MAQLRGVEVSEDPLDQARRMAERDPDYAPLGMTREELDYELSLYPEGNARYARSKIAGEE